MKKIILMLLVLSTFVIGQEPGFQRFDRFRTFNGQDNVPPDSMNSWTAVFTYPNIYTVSLRPSDVQASDKSHIRLYLDYQNQNSAAYTYLEIPFATLAADSDTVWAVPINYGDWDNGVFATMDTAASDTLNPTTISLRIYDEAGNYSSTSKSLNSYVYDFPLEFMMDSWSLSYKGSATPTQVKDSVLVNFNPTDFPWGNSSLTTSVAVSWWAGRLQNNRVEFYDPWGGLFGDYYQGTAGSWLAIVSDTTQQIWDNGANTILTDGDSVVVGFFWSFATTANGEIVRSTHLRMRPEVQVYYPVPDINSFTSTGDAVWADSVYIQLDVDPTLTGKVNVYSGPASQTDTTSLTSILGGWQTIADLDTTIAFPVGQDSTVNFYAFTKNSYHKTTYITRATTIYDAYTPPAPDTTPPNTTGTIALFQFVRPNSDTLDVTTIGSDSADVTGYKIYGRSSVKEAYVELVDVSAVNDTVLSMFKKVSIDGNDTAFVKIAAYDEVGNIDQTGLTAFQAPEDTSFQIKLLSYPGTWSWAQFEFSALDSTSDGDSLYTLSTADSTMLTAAGTDTLSFRADSLHYHLNDTMYTRVKFDDGAWGPWFKDTLSAVPPASYLAEETFDGTGYVLSWTESGTPNEDYATAPAPLEGTQSWYDATLGESAYHQLAASQSSINVYGMVNVTTRSASNTPTFALYTTTSSVCFLLTLRATGSGTVWRLVHGTVQANFNATVGYSDGTTYHVWIDWTAETGAGNLDGVANVYIATSATKPGAADATITTGDQELAGQRVYINGGNSGQIFDHIVVDDATIGSNP